MSQKYKNVSSLIKGMSTDNQSRDMSLQEIKNRSVSRFLFASRCKHNMTQKQLADKIGCSQGRISKIETSYDRYISIGDLLDYANALNLQLEVGFRHHSIKLVDLIKYHAFKIDENLEKLRKLAEDDDQIKEAIKNFHGEALFNIGKIVLSSLAKMDIGQKKMQEKTPIHISAPFVDNQNIHKTEHNLEALQT